jgi:hypothetical protein
MVLWLPNSSTTSFEDLNPQLFVGIHANWVSLSILVLSRTCALLNSSIYFQISLEIYKKSVSNEVVLELGSHNTINLEPYIYELSSNVKDYCDTFIALGVKEISYSFDHETNID